MATLEDVVNEGYAEYRREQAERDLREHAEVVAWIRHALAALGVDVPANAPQGSLNTMTVGGVVFGRFEADCGDYRLCLVRFCPHCGKAFRSGEIRTRQDLGRIAREDNPLCGHDCQKRGQKSLDRLRNALSDYVLELCDGHYARKDAEWEARRQGM